VIIWINEAKDSPSNNNKKLRKQINGKFNNIGSADETKFKKYHCRTFI
jgi:hypothetical protein